MTRSNVHYIERALAARVTTLDRRIARNRSTIAEHGSKFPGLAAEVARGNGRLLAERAAVAAAWRQLVYGGAE